MRWQRPNILAPGLRSAVCSDSPSSRLHRRAKRRLALGSRIQLQQRNCSRFARDFSHRSTFLKLAKNWNENYLVTLRIARFISSRVTKRRPRATIEPAQPVFLLARRRFGTMASRFSVALIALAIYRKITCRVFPHDAAPDFSSCMSNSPRRAIQGLICSPRV
jgi:hypothetical protein